MANSVKMEMKFNEEQAAAIENTGKADLIISASAGTGKTATLIESVSGLIVAKGMGIDSILIVTFTEKAASELKTKLAKRIQDEMIRIQHSNDDKSAAGAELRDEKLRHLSEQLQSLDWADISTFHSFCKKVAERNFNAVNMNPKARVLDAGEAEILLSKAVDMAIREDYLSSNPGPAVKSYMDVRDGSGLKDKIIYIYKAAASRGEPEEFLLKAIDKTRNYDFDRLMNNTLLRAYFLFEKVLNNYRRAYSFAENEGLDIHVADLGDYEQVLKEISGLFAEVWGTDDVRVLFLKIRETFASLNIAAKPRLKKDDPMKESDGIYNELYRKKFTAALKDAKELFEPDLDGIRAGIDASLDLAVSLLELAGRSAEIFREEKDRLSVIDYDDMQFYALKALRIPEIAASYSELYKYIFVDEYQDSSYIQDELINLIKNPEGLFLVGDYKQSIYGFRNAVPKLFSEKSKSFKDKPSSLAISMNSNYRSYKWIIDAVNAVFCNIMAPEYGEIDYRNEHLLLPFRTNEKNEDAAVPRITVYDLDFIDEDVENGQKEAGEPEIGDFGDESIEKSERETAEADENSLYYALIRHVKDLHELEGYRYGDITILMRNPNNTAGRIKSLFAAGGIELAIDVDEDIFTKPEIATIMDFIKVASNPYDDTALLAVMRSPLGNFSDDDLFALAEARISVKSDLKEKKKTAYADFLYEVDSFEIQDFELKEKLKNLKTHIDRFLKDEGISLRDRLVRLLEETAYRNYLLTRRGKKELLVNLDGLYDFVSGFEISNSSSVFELAKHYEDLLSGKNSKTYKAKTADTGDMVRLMSIHKSKGLQFKVVVLFMPGVGKNEKGFRDVLFTEDGSLAVGNVERERGIRYGNYLIDCENFIKRRDEKLEEARLLYVAMTRAEERLEVVTACKPEKLFKKIADLSENKNLALRDCRSFMDYMICGLDFSEPLSDYVPEDVFKSHGKIYKLGDHWELVFKEAVGEVPAAEDVKDTRIEVSKFVEQAYEIGKVGVSRSVTALKKMLAEGGGDCRGSAVIGDLDLLDEGEDLKRPSSIFKNKGDFSAMRRGTAYHFALQYFVQKGMDFDKFVEKSGLETVMEDDFALIDLAVIEKFSASQLYARIKKSDKVMTEKPFVYKWEIKGETVYVRGIIDLAFVEDGKMVIVDYKSDKNKTAEELQDAYKFQLDLYAEAVEKITGMEVKEKLIYHIG